MAKPPLNGVAETEYTKSQQGGLAPSSFRTTVRRARVSRASHAWRVRATKDKVKIDSFATLRSLNHTTRANISHEKAEQIRVRIVCTPAESARRAWVWYLRRRNEEISTIYTSSVSLRLPPSPTGEGWQNAELFSKKNFDYPEKPLKYKHIRRISD